MKFVLLVYQGSTPLPGSNGWQALTEAEQKAIYADYAELNKAESMEAAIAVAARVPAARLGGAVEIRPAEKYW